MPRRRCRSRPRPIRYGQTVNGELSDSDPQMDDDSHFDLWKFTGRQGDKIVITMKSTVFDTYAAFGRLGEGEFIQIESDDDGAGGTDSKIEYTLESDGEYVIRANSLFSKGLGAYTPEHHSQPDKQRRSRRNHEDTRTCLRGSVVFRRERGASGAPGPRWEG